MIDFDRWTSIFQVPIVLFECLDDVRFDSNLLEAIKMVHQTKNRFRVWLLLLIQLLFLLITQKHFVDVALLT